MLLEIEDAHKSFGEHRALDGARLQLDAGEKLALLGPNGAGKTTLVRTTSGRVRLDRGTVSLAGRALQVGDPRLELGIVPQEIALYPELSASENLQVFGRFCGVDRRRLGARVDWALDWTGLSQRAKEPVKTFSGGMKRRVNIACATLHEPRVLILDEPTVGVDPQSRERIYDMLEVLCDQGTAVLLATHQLDEAEVRCDRVVILDHGCTIADGTVAELIAKTIGTQRTVSIRVDRDVEQPIDGFTAGATRRDLTLQVSDVAAELAPVLTLVRDGGYAIEDVTVHGPGLQAVFLHLTGRELRE